MSTRSHDIPSGRSLSDKLKKYGVAAGAASVSVGAVSDADAAVSLFDNGGAGWGPFTLSLQSNPLPPATNLLAAFSAKAASATVVGATKSSQAASKTLGVNFYQGKNPAFGEPKVINALSVDAAKGSAGHLPLMSSALIGPSLTSLAAGSQRPMIYAIGTSLVFKTAGPWNNGQRAYLGFTTPEGNYGWADLTVSLNTLPFTEDPPNSSATITIHAIGVEETPGLPIEAGSTASIPEPSSALLLVAGAAGLGVLRRRRNERERA